MAARAPQAVQSQAQSGYFGSEIQANHFIDQNLKNPSLRFQQTNRLPENAGDTKNSGGYSDRANLLETQTSRQDELEAWSKRLSFPNMDRRHLKLGQTRPVSGTCEWLFTHEKYQSWETNDTPNHATSTLLIEGKAGSGKSTLMNRAVARAEAMREDSDSICLSYFFDAANDEGLSIQISPQGLYRSVLSQLLRKIKRSPDIVALVSKWGTASKAEDETVEDIVILKDRLTRLLATIRSKTFRIFIDAIDECGKGKDSGTTDTLDMLNYLKGLQGEGCSMLVLLSIRDRTQFGSILAGPSIDMSNHNRQDISKYLEDNLTYTTSPDGRAQLIRTLLHRSSNVFLWIVLVVERINLKEGLEDTELEAEVKRMPRELEGIYTALLEDLDIEARSQALILLQLVQVCMRPLDLLEVRSALEYAKGIDGGLSRSKLSEEAFEKRIRRIC